jgi:peptidoglycan/xylan/chitin deacetylase (PgdA/CDA1 family)
MNVVERLSRRYCQWSAARFCRRPVDIRCERPIVSFSFDDFPRTATSAGGQVLKDLGIRGTYFVAFGLETSPTSGGTAFTIDDLHQVVSDGHELGCHTYGHELSHRVTSKRYEASVQRNQDRLRELHLKIPWRVFAYPAGSASAGTKRIVQARFLCGRGTSPGINADNTDLNLLRANSLYSAQRPVESHIARVDDVIAKKGWLIFYTHDVQDNPSRYGCTPEYLRIIAQAAVDSGAEVLRIGDAISKILTIHTRPQASPTAPAVS